MAIVKQFNKKTGITYVYESHSYRDKETKQPRAKRKLIGRLDEETGEIIPTRKKSKNVTTYQQDVVDTNQSSSAESSSVLLQMIRERDALISSQKSEIAKLHKERGFLASELEKRAKRLQNMT